MTSGCLWNYYRNDVNDNANENNSDNVKINNNKTIASKSFEYKTKILGKREDNNNTLDTEVVVSLKYMSNFWRFLTLPLNICEIELDLPWSENFINSEIWIMPWIPAKPDVNPRVQQVAEIQTTGVTFQIKNAELYVPVVTLSVNNSIKFLKNIKQEFRKKNLLEQI